MSADAKRCFFVTMPGFEAEVRGELERLGFHPEDEPGGVACSLTMADLMRAHLWARVPTRVLVRVGEVAAKSGGQLTKRAEQLDWAPFFGSGTRVALRLSYEQSRLKRPEQVLPRLEAALSASLGRTVVAGDEGDLGTTTVYARIQRDRCQLSVDASGAALYKRTAGKHVAKAPLRETMAAGILMAAGWTPDEPLLDPMCGSGTIVTEAAAMAASVAPGATREFAFMHWPGFELDAWESLVADAKAQTQLPPSPIVGRDRNAAAIAAAQRNATALGLLNFVNLEQGVLSAARPAGDRAGLVISNPPYGHRVGDTSTVRNLYGALGQLIRDHFPGWRVALLTDDPKLAYVTGLKGIASGPVIPHGGLKVRLFQWRP